MKYPEYDPEITRRPPVRGFLSLFARMEGGVASRLTPKKWDSTLAELSYLHVKGDNGRFRSNLRIARQFVGVPTLHEPLRESMKFLNNPNQLKRMQEDLHTRTMTELDGALREYRRGKINRGNTVGKVTELVTIGLMTRYAHPWMLISPSLPHHEQDDTKKEQHFDVALAISSGEADESYYLQVKRACTGRCCNERLVFGHRYDSRIQFVSGCCDLGLGATGENIDTTIPRLLLAEHADSATPEDIKQLDILTDNLLFNISADLMPRGYVTA